MTVFGHQDGRGGRRGRLCSLAHREHENASRGSPQAELLYDMLRSCGRLGDCGRSGRATTAAWLLLRTAVEGCRSRPRRDGLGETPATVAAALQTRPSGRICAGPGPSPCGSAAGRTAPPVHVMGRLSQGETPVPVSRDVGWCGHVTGSRDPRRAWQMTGMRSVPPGNVGSVASGVRRFQHSFDLGAEPGRNYRFFPFFALFPSHLPARRGGIREPLGGEGRSRSSGGGRPPRPTDRFPRPPSRPPALLPCGLACLAAAPSLQGCRVAALARLCLNIGRTERLPLGAGETHRSSDAGRPRRQRCRRARQRGVVGWDPMPPGPIAPCIGHAALPGGGEAVEWSVVVAVWPLPAAPVLCRTTPCGLLWRYRARSPGISVR